MSMKPGATTSREASMRRRALACDRSPTAVMRSPRTPTSARNQGAPEPSTTGPPEKTRSYSSDGGTGAPAARAAVNTTAAPRALTRLLALFLAGQEVLAGDLPLRRLVAHVDVFDDALVAVFVHHLDVPGVAGDVGEDE